uniref:WDR5-like beta-propeller domain-containing protein n=1 Tax=Ditylum brightwellii TaxID=49249 RepID=A0A6S8VLB2_9STRA|mmetsp:Transcript_26714/g.39401  ORF Transcript_26714/g.39401 Transcript_26714/m.39401 type:complete len:556 (+) Transcript_26714:178-1845(+)
MKRNITEAGVATGGMGGDASMASSSPPYRMGAGVVNPESSSTTATTAGNHPGDQPYIVLPYHGEHKRAISSVRFAPSAPYDTAEGGGATARAPGATSAAALASALGGDSSATSRTVGDSIGPRKSTTACLLASASADGTAKIWELTHTMLDRVSKWYGAPNAPSNKNLIPIATLVGHARGINDVCWSRTAEYVATASDDKTLRLWDVQTSDALVEFRGHTNFVFSCNFNPQSNLLVSGSFDETVKLWDVRSGDCVSTLPAHSDPVTGVDFNRDGTCIVSGSHDGLIRVWDAATGECLKTIYAGGNPPVSHVRFSPNGRFVLSGTLDSKLRLWDVLAKGGGNGNAHDGSKRKRTFLNTGVGADGGMGLGFIGASGNKGGIAGVRDYDDPSEAAAALQRQLLELSSGGGGGNGEMMRTSIDDPLSSTAGANRGGRCTKTYNGHVNTRYCIFSCFSVANKSRQSVVTGSEDGRIFLYDLQSRQVRQILNGGHSDAVLAVDAHDTREIICSGGMSNDRSIKFWMPITPSVGKRKRKTDHGPTGGVNAVASLGYHETNEG